MVKQHLAPKRAWYSLQLLKSHYEEQIEECDRQITELFKQSQFAKEQINHVQALLDDLELVDEWTAGAAITYLDRTVKNNR
ncbi:hypothetical protein B7486_42470 [cyanobacterium TDX16]|nr:hypothetical protein B7486_42470 [cyanobacterium TDX16]